MFLEGNVADLWMQKDKSVQRDKHLHQLFLSSLAQQEVF